MDRMKYFYDTEFLEDGVTIDLISIGIVCEDGRTYYAVSEDADYFKIRQNSWLMDNVMSSIPYESRRLRTGRRMTTISPVGEYVKSRKEIRDEIIEFVGEDNPEFWAWYGAYDHVALCQLFGKMIDLPSNFPMFTREIRQYWEAKGCPPMPKQAKGNHNALEDARHNMIMFDYLEGVNEQV